MNPAGDIAYEHGPAPDAKRLPAWLRRPIASRGSASAVEGVLGELSLNTVCQSAKCPNRPECFSGGTATFLVMGDACTRACGFCGVRESAPAPLDPDEPRRVAEAAVRLRLSHVVVTMVTRDDIADGGAAHLAAVIEAVREAAPGVSVEVLTSDFAGGCEAIDTVADARPDVLAHNVETVPRLYELVRPGARYERSLAVLRRFSAGLSAPPVKSGLMLGLGESAEEVVDVMRDLRSRGVEMLTLGQYLRPGPAQLPVARFVEPDAFAALERQALALGFNSVASAPLVRSSYRAKEMLCGDQPQTAIGNSTI